MIQIYRDGKSIKYYDGITVRFYSDFTLLIDETKKDDPKVRVLPVAVMDFMAPTDVLKADGSNYSSLDELVRAVGPENCQAFNPSDYDQIREIYDMNQTDDTAEFWRNKVGKSVIMTNDVYAYIKSSANREEKYTKLLKYIVIQTDVCKFNIFGENTLIQYYYNPWDEVNPGLVFRYIYPDTTGRIDEKWTLYVMGGDGSGPTSNIDIVQELSESKTSVPSAYAVKHALENLNLIDFMPDGEEGQIPIVLPDGRVGWSDELKNLKDKTDPFEPNLEFSFSEKDRALFYYPELGKLLYSAKSTQAVLKIKWNPNREVSRVRINEKDYSASDKETEIQITNSGVINFKFFSGSDIHETNLNYEVGKFPCIYFSNEMYSDGELGAEINYKINEVGKLNSYPEKIAGPYYVGILIPTEEYSKYSNFRVNNLPFDGYSEFDVTASVGGVSSSYKLLMIDYPTNSELKNLNITMDYE